MLNIVLTEVYKMFGHRKKLTRHAPRPVLDKATRW
jgi:hypothetical protein